MNTVAIVGAGAVGAHLARTLAPLELAREIRLIDSNRAAAQGKALDIQQVGPLAGFDTRVRGLDDVAAVTGASVVVLADPHQAAPEPEEPVDVDVLRRVAAASPRTPIILARADHHIAMERAMRELQLSRTRIIGSAPQALVSVARAMVALAAGASPCDVSVSVFGVPGRWVLAWSEATIAGRPVSDTLAAHEVIAVEARIRASWPPGPYSLASAAASVTGGMLTRSRRRFTCFAALDGEWRHRVGAVSVALGSEGIVSREEPALSARERVQLATALSV